MATEDDLERIERAVNSGRLGSVKGLEKKAVNWWIDKIQEVNQGAHPTRFRARGMVEKISPDEYLYGKRPILGNPVVGQMFSYKYDPKHKLTLSYYDIFPIVLIIEPKGAGWLGLNLHYLPPAWRARLLRLIMETMSSKKLSREAKARVTYSLIKGASRLKIAIPCLKQYLANHVASKIVRILPEEWVNVTALPMDVFQKMPRDIVWRESIAKINARAAK